MSAPLAHGGLGTYTVTAADVENARQIEEQLHGRDPGGGRSWEMHCWEGATGLSEYWCSKPRPPGR